MSSQQQPRSRNNKRARVDEEEATKEEDQDVRLCAALRGLLGGSKYVKQNEISREVLLSYAIQQGDVVPVTLLTVTVQPLAGDIFDVQMEEKQNSVKQLRLLIRVIYLNPFCFCFSVWIWDEASPLVPEYVELGDARTIPRW